MMNSQRPAVMKRGPTSTKLMTRNKAAKAGEYKVSVTYNRVKGIGGGEFAVNMDGKSLKQSVESGEMTPDLHKGDVVTREMGTLKVPAGRHELSITAVNIPPAQELIRFIGVTLTPVGGATLTTAR